mmetsp:Transcript_5560/g.13493  ORF Transcript_5560/g.13493 Transcript_5560/m.13493 type:complete len:365 (-) Transcript_5560:828-1922(-)
MGHTCGAAHLLHQAVGADLSHARDCPRRHHRELPDLHGGQRRQRLCHLPPRWAAVRGLRASVAHPPLRQQPPVAEQRLLHDSDLERGCGGADVPGEPARALDGVLVQATEAPARLLRDAGAPFGGERGHQCRLPVGRPGGGALLLRAAHAGRRQPPAAPVVCRHVDEVLTVRLGNGRGADAVGDQPERKGLRVGDPWRRGRCRDGTRRGGDEEADSQGRFVRAVADGARHGRASDCRRAPLRGRGHQPPHLRDEPDAGAASLPLRPGPSGLVRRPHHLPVQQRRHEDPQRPALNFPLLSAGGALLRSLPPAHDLRHLRQGGRPFSGHLPTQVHVGLLVRLQRKSLSRERERERSNKRILKSDLC